jgi:C4-type Zn-finger protein
MFMTLLVLPVCHTQLLNYNHQDKKYPHYSAVFIALLACYCGCAQTGLTEY